MVVDYNAEPGVAVVRVKSDIVGTYATELPMYLVYKLGSRGEIALYNQALDDQDLEQIAYLTSKVLGRFPWKVVIHSVTDFGTEPLRAFQAFAVEEEAKGAAKSAGKGKQQGDGEEDGTSKGKGSKGKGKGRNKGKGRKGDKGDKGDDDGQPGASDGGSK